MSGDLARLRIYDLVEAIEFDDELATVFLAVGKGDGNADKLEETPGIRRFDLEIDGPIEGVGLTYTTGPKLWVQSAALRFRYDFEQGDEERLRRIAAKDMRLVHRAFEVASAWADVIVMLSLGAATPGTWTEAGRTVGWSYVIPVAYQFYE